jgi:hypothetical protein
VSRVTSIARALLALLPMAVLVACDDDLPEATEIVHLRVLGASVEVIGDEARATPKPGESVRMTLQTVFPSLQRDGDAFVPLEQKRRRLRALVISCTAPDRYTGGIPICQELIDVATGVVELPAEIPAFDPNVEFRCPDSMRYGPVGPLSLNCTQGTPVVELYVPEDYRRDRLLFSGIVCEQGTPVPGPSAQEPFVCDGLPEGGEAIRIHGLIPVQQDDSSENHNPDISGLRIVREIDGEWDPVDPMLLTPENEDQCEAASRQRDDAMLPLLYGNIDFTLIYDGVKRERFEGVYETLELSLYTTAGDMERRFTLFEPDEPTSGENQELRASLRYTPPKKGIPPGGQLVRFYATVRDQRGGFAMAEYALCLGQLLLPKRD